MDNKYFEKYQKYKMKYFNLKKKNKEVEKKVKKIDYLVQRTNCSEPNIQNPTECLKNDFPCVTPDLSCSDINNSQTNGKIRSITVGDENLDEIKENISRRRYGLPPPGINCKGQNIYNNVECTNPKYPCVTPTLRCATLENSDTNPTGIKGIAKSLALTREEIDEELIKNQMFNDRERYRIRLRYESNDDHNFNNLFKLDDFIACGKFACFFKLKDEFDKPVDLILRTTPIIQNELNGLRNQYKLHSHPFINKIYSYGLYILEEFDNSTKTYKLSNMRPQQFLCDKDNQLIDNCSHQNLLNSDEGYYSIIEPCLGGNLSDKILKTNIYNNEQVIKDVMRNIFTGIKFIHDNNILLGNLSAKNIGLVNNHDPSNINILDFSQSVNLNKFIKERKVHWDIKLVSDLDYSPKEVLEDGYNPSPEQLYNEDEKKEYDSKFSTLNTKRKFVDIYSAGVILFLLLFKKYPRVHYEFYIRYFNYYDTDIRFKFNKKRKKWMMYSGKKDFKSIPFYDDSQPKDIFEPIDEEWLGIEIGKYENSNAKNVIDLCLLCLQDEPSDRPTIDEVLEHPWFN